MSEPLTFPSLKRIENHKAGFPFCYLGGLPRPITVGKYQVGLLEGFEESDPIIHTLEGAQHKATDLSFVEVTKTDFYMRAYAVWDMPSGDVVSIHYCGATFTA